MSNASGDDEELKEALDDLNVAYNWFYNWEWKADDEVRQFPTLFHAEKAIVEGRTRIESLFGRMREERDRAYHTISGLEQDIERYESGEL